MIIAAIWYLIIGTLISCWGHILAVLGGRNIEITAKSVTATALLWPLTLFAKGN